MTRLDATTRNRHRFGAVMMETVLVVPFIMVALMLIVYLGWNFRRVAQVTNMDRYAVWESATPGSPGPDAQGLEQDIRNPRLNTAFFGHNSDQAKDLDELRGVNAVAYMPEGHRSLRDEQTDESYSYFDAFLGRSPAGLHQRFTATHSQSMNTDLLGLSDLIRNGQGHSRVNGDWRYLNGVGYNSEKDKWEPQRRRVAPGEALREVFFVDLDDGLSNLAGQNEYAAGVRDFYLAYPVYRGPEIDTDGEQGNVAAR